MALTIAIDLGTTNLKVGLVDEEGDILSVVSRPLHTYSSEPGAAEHNPGELTSLLSGMGGKLLKDVNKDQIGYIVSSTYQFGMMMLDEQRKPVTHITLLTDIRSQEVFSEFMTAFADVPAHLRRGQPGSAGLSGEGQDGLCPGTGEADRCVGVAVHLGVGD